MRSIYDVLYVCTDFMSLQNQVVYIVAGASDVNDRIQKIYSLSGQFHRMVLVSVGKHNSFEGDLYRIKPCLNPVGVFRLFGLVRLKKIIDKILYFPTYKALYAKAVKKKLCDVIAEDLKDGRDVCVITTVPPHDVCMVGLHLKSEFPQIRWIVDWRDLWSYDEVYLKRTSKLYRNRLLDVEKKILMGCDLNITTNDYAKSVLVNEYGVSPSVVLPINQSFHRDDLKSELAEDYSSLINAGEAPIKIGFLGNIHKPPRVSGNKIIDAFKSVRDRGLDVELHIYGDSSPVTKAKVESECDWLKLHKKVAHRESLKNISSCDYLLLSLEDIPNSRAVMSLKLASYMLVRKPILAVVPGVSAVAEIVKRTGAGYVIPAEGDWVSGIEKILNENLDGGPFPIRNEEEIAQYDWENVSKRWMGAICGKKVD